MKKIVFFNWKDIGHPNAGGAEIVCWNLCKRLAQGGYQVSLVTSEYQNAKKREIIDNVSIYRVGTNKYTHSFQALWFYIRNLKNKNDIIIECVNTVPYFLKFFRGNEKIFLVYHQLAKEVWFYETRFPINFLGYYILEKIAIYLQTIKHDTIITISKSSKQDLIKHGFKANKIFIITMGITNAPLKQYQAAKKNQKFTILFHSSLRPMKRPEDVIMAFSIFHQKYPNSQLYLSGGGNLDKYKSLAKKLRIEDSVTFFGRVGDKKKLNLMQQSSFLCSTSIKEGWGLILTEANSMGTPAITYDVDGLRDACKRGHGFISKFANPESLVEEFESGYQLFTLQRNSYDDLCRKSLESSRSVNFENCYFDFLKIIES
ncbi:MAG: glycosyltransferase family 4 protein [Patescibacteria group bacterium]